MSAQFKGQKSALNDHQTVLETHFLQNPPLSSKEAIQSIKELTNISRSPSQLLITHIFSGNIDNL